MLVDATLLIQDIQLLCFAVIFGVLALQRGSDTTRRWLWYGFLANAVGAACDLLAARLPDRAVVRAAGKGATWAEHGCEAAIADMNDAVALTAAFIQGKY